MEGEESSEISHRRLLLKPWYSRGGIHNPETGEVDCRMIEGSLPLAGKALESPLTGA
jgi:hypothetical protein